MSQPTLLSKLRSEFHRKVCSSAIYCKSGNVPSLADTGSKLSRNISNSLIRLLNNPVSAQEIKAQTAGGTFERITKDFLAQAFALISHLRPGEWAFSVHGDITQFDQYGHLGQISQFLNQNKELKTALGDYLIAPDIIVARQPVTDAEINKKQIVVNDDDLAQFTPLRLANSSQSILHASISCKLTLRSDRSQNARTEGLNLIRNRKGRTPHIAIVTAEPMPSRIASLALGTGDIDCVYHFALPELRQAVNELSELSAGEMLDLMMTGRRLRDISDLPFDLVI
ncbi:MAG: NgoMIV family type II restriction endonuclease [Acidobacteriota bacterium]|nr:NgoMIV family type II restriction endonuclease [Acidobacteriota bacterium]